MCTKVFFTSGSFFFLSPRSRNSRVPGLAGFLTAGVASCCAWRRPKRTRDLSPGGAAGAFGVGRPDFSLRVLIFIYSAG
ncbi:hypothetical protein B0H17DRAFT_1045113 [Mycena rosella]|uniref:Uncharacterized protein n=1 Tax=Mycena rosella TaxID=1033263 RepID=A0AAD7E0A0_MYCRO|nr:hypothetical protein B0H17DRAFT_1045113 [Mycena rosella]